MAQTGYVQGSNPSAAPGGTMPEVGSDQFWTLDRCKKAYDSYLTSKSDEIKEQQNGRRYYHGVQWTTEQLKELQKRKQPAVTFNRISRKLNGLVGLTERMSSDPKAFPRTPKEQAGADLATAVVRYVLETARFETMRAEVTLTASIDGIAGVERELVQGDNGDPDVSLSMVSTDGFFYDPRSVQMDFADAMYMGVGKWVDLETAEGMFPYARDAIVAAMPDDTALTTGSDRDNKWFSSDDGMKRIRLVEIWYKRGDQWLWCIFTGAGKVMQGQSYFFDEKGKSACKYIMFSAAVDQDGDRYGFIRNLKSAQDETNHRRSKALHLLNSKRLILRQGAVADVEKARREWARPDGIIELNDDVNVGIKVDDTTAEIRGQLEFLKDSREEIENFGFNPALVGSGVNDMSGRAINLMQQAGIAELGPFLSSRRGWLMRVYRAVWCDVKQHWQGERWVRVTDDQNMAQFIQVNGIGIDPQTGMVQPVNQLGALDVDIVMDEGPDVQNMMADAYDTLTVLASKGAQMPPQVLIELAPLPNDVKQKLLQLMDQSQQADPALQQAKQIELAQGAAKVDETKANAELKQAQTVKTMMEAHMQPMKAAHEMELQRSADMRASANQDYQQAVDFSRLQMDQQAAQQPANPFDVVAQ